MHVIVTGANGFVGRALCRTLVLAGHRVTGIVRRPGSAPTDATECIDSAPDFASIEECWPGGHGDVDCLVHLAARVHVMDEPESDATQRAFDATNVEGTLRVAQAAHRRGVKRFVYVSSIKAVSDSDMGYPLREDVPPRPDDAYGRSKLAAERALADLRDTLDLDVVIVRPPLVYGPEVGANFLRMLNVVWGGVPLPLARVTARRSVLFVDNLVDALMHCVEDPRAANGCFHVADDVAPSVAELLRAIGRHLGRPVHLVPVPVTLLRCVGRVTGRMAQIDRLTTSLTLDTSAIREQLGWRPPYSLDDGLSATAAWYRSMRGSEAKT